MGYRSETEALLEKNKALESELLALRERSPKALEQRVANLESELSSLQDAKDLAAQDETYRWVIDAYALNGRRMGRRLWVGTALMIAVFFVPALWGGKPVALAVPSVGIWLATLFWAGSATAYCPRCNAKLSRAVRAGRKRRCETCQVAVRPPLAE